MNTPGMTEEWGRSISRESQGTQQVGRYADASGSHVSSLVSRVSAARDGAAVITTLPLCAQTSMIVATFYSFFILLPRIIWEFFLYSPIIEICDIHDHSGFSY